MCHAQVMCQKSVQNCSVAAELADSAAMGNGRFERHVADRSYAWALVLLTVFLGGCSFDSSTPLIPSPTLMRESGYDPYANAPVTWRSTEIPVLYATSRRPVRASDRFPWYGNDGAGEMRYGVATATIGRKGRTSFDEVHAALMGRAPNAGIDVNTTEAVEVADETAFVTQVNRAVAETGDGHVVVFVHGFNTDFPQTVSRLSQLSHIMGRGRTCIAFAWPSGQSVLGYARDMEVALGEASRLAGLFRLLAERTDVTQIHVLGYSAGAPVTSEALLLRARELASGADETSGRHRSKLGTVMLVGADLDLEKWGQQHLPAYGKYCRRVVVTVSADDPALAIASAIHGTGRVGGAWGMELTAQQRRDMDAVSDRIEFLDMTYREPSGAEARNGAGNLTGHFGWYQSPWVVSDVLLALRHDLPASVRGLARVPEGGFWYFPNDYTERLKKLPLP